MLCHFFRYSLLLGTPSKSLYPVTEVDRAVDVDATMFHTMHPIFG